jgi:hypothetical protein
VIEPGSVRALPLSIEETDLLVRLLSDELGPAWRHDRHPQEDVAQLHRRLVEFRAGWTKPEQA